MCTAIASTHLAASRDYRELAAEADKILLANRQFVPDACTAGSSQPLGADMGTAAAVTGLRQQDEGWCYHHAWYGAKAKQCRQPCSFKVQGNTRASTQLQL